MQFDRRSVRGICSIVAVALMTTGVALAAPRRSTSYTGAGRLCLKMAGKRGFGHCTNLQEQFSFRVTARRTEVLGFSGTLGPLGCTGATYRLGTSPIPVTKRSFSASFDRSIPGGTGEVRIQGKFKARRTAAIVYDVILHFHHDHPSCGGRVKGIADAVK